MNQNTNKTLLLAGISAALFSTIFTPQSAEARPSTRSYSCEALRDYIYHRGAVVMNTKNSHVYRRFVSDSSFCRHGERAIFYSVPDRTGHRCTINICGKPEFRRRRN